MRLPLRPKRAALTGVAGLRSGRTQRQQATGYGKTPIVAQPPRTALSFGCGQAFPPPVAWLRAFRVVPFYSALVVYFHSALDSLVVSDGYAASFEIKGPWGIRGSNNPLKNEAQKVNQFIPDVPAAERYDGWSLSLQDDQATKALEQFVRSALQNLSAVIMYVVSNPNPISLQIKRAPRAMSRFDGHGYECLRVIVFNGVKPNEKCDGCRQQVAASKLLPIGGGSIKVCRTCLVQATAMVRQ
jgi:hypothetical protein